MFHPRSMWFVINTIMIELYFLLMGLLARYGLIIMNRRQNAHVTDMVAIFVQMHISPYQLRCFKGLYFPLTLNLWKCLPYKSFGISNWPYLLNRVKHLGETDIYIYIYIERPHFKSLIYMQINAIYKCKYICTYT